MRRLFITVILLFLLSVTAFAEEEGFETEKMTKEQIEELSFSVEILADDTNKRRITGFDVYDDGSFAIISTVSNQEYIYVYDADGKFEYGVTFFSYGSSSIELIDSAIKIYSVRGDIAYTVNSNGEIINYEKILDTVHNNSYWNKLQARKKHIDGATYEMKYRKLFVFPWYSELIVTYPNGESDVLYKADMNIIAEVLLLCSVIGISVYYINYTKKRRKAKQSANGLKPLTRQGRF